MDEIYEEMTQESESKIIRKRELMEYLVIKEVAYQFVYTTKENVIHILSREPINLFSRKSKDWGAYITVGDIRKFPEIIRKEMYVEYWGTTYKVMQLYGKNENEGFVVTIPGMGFEEGKKCGFSVDWYAFSFPYLDIRRQDVSKILIKTTVVPNDRYKK